MNNRGGLGSAMAGANFSNDILEAYHNIIEAIPDVIRGYANHSNISFVEESVGPMGIGSNFGGVEMNLAINLYGEIEWDTEKVDDIVPDDMLAPKFVAE